MFGPEPRIHIQYGTVEDLGSSYFLLALDGNDIGMYLDSISQNYPIICGTYDYSIELSDPSHDQYFDLVGNEISIATSTLQNEFIALLTVKVFSDYYEATFISTATFSVLRCEVYVAQIFATPDYTMTNNGYSGATVLDLSVESTKVF